MRARELPNVFELEAEDAVEADGVEGLHLVLLDGLAIDRELRLLQLRYHVISPLAVAQQEQEFMDEELVVGVFVVGVAHLLLVLEVFLHAPDVPLEVLSLLLLALQHRPVLLYPGADQLIRYRLVYQAERPLNDRLLQGDVGFFELLLDKGESVDARTDVLQREEVAPVEHQRCGH